MPSSRRQARRKFSASAVRWKPRKSAPSSPSTSGASPGQLGEQLDRREGDVVEPADAHVRAQLAHHGRHQLQLVVVHPHGAAGGDDLGDGLGEPAVDVAVGVPPGPVERRRDDDVVVDGPEGVVAEALVVPAHLALGERHRREVHVVLLERLRGVAGLAGPADPGALPAPHDRLHRRDEAARTAPPGRLAVGADDAVHRQAVGGDDQIERRGGRAHTYQLLRRGWCHPTVTATWPGHP